MSRPAILVTGSAGFVGAGVCHRLLEQGHLVVGIDNLNDYYDVRLKNFRLETLACFPNFEFERVDLKETERLESLFQQFRFETVYHLAAQAGVRYSLERPEVYFQTNVLGALHVLEAMKRHEVKKFVLASTSSLYSTGEGPYDETAPVDKPRSPYSASKRAAELLAHSYHVNFGIDVSVLRYFTVYGPAGRPDMSILRFIHWLANDQPIYVYGDGRQARDFSFIDDIVEGTLRAQRPVGYEVINLGGGQVVDLHSLIDRLAHRLQRSPRIVYLDSHPSDLKQTWADTRKAHELLDWKPTTDFDTGLEQTVLWYEQNRSWLERLEFLAD